MMQVEQEQLAFIASFVRKRSGMVLRPEKAYLIEARLGEVARSRGLESFRALTNRLHAQDAELENEVIDAMTVNETSFYRDLVPFHVIKQRMLPEVVERRSAEKSINLWCAASSTGQEPYTVAMLIREHFPQLRDWRVRFVASDISDTVLERARSGVYSQLEVNRGLPAPLLLKYFTRVSSGWQVSDEVRALVDFRKINLLGDWKGIHDIDIVLMRNVLIYFDVDTKRDILARVRDRLAPHGFLMLGGAESTLNIDEGYERLANAKCSAYRLKAGRS